MKKNVFNFTHNELMKIKPPKKGREKYNDPKEQGLVLIVSYGGSKVFYYGKKIDGDYKLLRIGHFPEVSIADARKKATEFKALIAQGINPVKKVVASSNDIPTEMNFKELFDKYINDYAKQCNKTWKNDLVVIERHAKHLYDRGISTIQREDIQKIFNGCIKPNATNLRTGKIAANRCLSKLKAIFNMAIKWELLEKNPAIGIIKFKENSRDRYLTSEEKPVFFEIVEQEATPLMKDYVHISLYTGARKSNVLSMEWPEINLTDKTWYIPAHKSKNGEAQLLPLTDEAVEILYRRKQENKSKWVFPSPRKSKSGHFQEPKSGWYKIVKKAMLEDFRIHDMRRTMGSWMAREGASQYIIGKALNHKSSDATAVYARINIDPVREFMQKAANSIMEPQTKKSA
nr:site-specific integrase [Rickettsia endosymbiont of Ceutorhynchus assimilis]